MIKINVQTHLMDLMLMQMDVLYNVFERLQGNTYRQIESVDDCGTCEDEINYYTFSENGLQISGTTLDGVCEQNDFKKLEIVVIVPE